MVLITNLLVLGCGVDGTVYPQNACVNGSKKDASQQMVVFRHFASFEDRDRASTPILSCNQQTNRNITTTGPESRTHGMVSC